MSSPPTRFHVREVDSAAGDSDFIIAAFDSLLPYLAAIGSQDQWGLTPFSKRDGWVEETMQQVQDAETYRRTGNGGALRILIVEAKVPSPHHDRGTDSDTSIGVCRSTDGRHEFHLRIKPERGQYVVPVGFAFIREDDVPGYITTQESLVIEDADRDSCVYIEVMAADHRVDASLRKGSGAALIQGIKDFGTKTRKRCLFIDGWAGNDKKLITLVLVPVPECLTFSPVQWRGYMVHRLKAPCQLLQSTGLPGDG